MVLDRSLGLKSANDLGDLFIAIYDSPRRTSGKTIILYNYGDVIMFTDRQSGYTLILHNNCGEIH